ncbi:hypothetical protein ACQCN2_13200 [Brevibacillus ginsengisoli]|uniref:hypothetical protein n=1 Tax=Brevibacillus ginsengisoli TaxID=363854 RepID=UPI003CE91FA4
MEKKTNLIILNGLLFCTLLLNLLIFTSRMSFLPWFIEDAVGYAGILFTTPILLAVFFFLHRLQRNGKVTQLNKFTPLVAAAVSLSVVFMNVTDLYNLLALFVNTVMLLMTCVIFFKTVAFPKTDSR